MTLLGSELASPRAQPHAASTFVPNGLHRVLQLFLTLFCLVNSRVLSSELLRICKETLNGSYIFRTKWLLPVARSKQVCIYVVEALLIACYLPG
jgi:hypothetical protein